MERYQENLEIIKSFVKPYKLTTDEQMYNHILKESFRANPITNHTITYDYERDSELLSNPYVKAVLDSGGLNHLKFHNGLSIIHICPMLYAEDERLVYHKFTQLELVAIFLFLKQGVPNWIDLTHSHCPSFTDRAKEFRNQMDEWIPILEFELTLVMYSLNDAIINICKNIPLDKFKTEEDVLELNKKY